MRIFTFFKICLYITFCFGYTVKGIAGTITSTSTGGAWSSSATWVGGIVPTFEDHVVIAANASISISTNVFCASINLTEDKAPNVFSLSIIGTNALTVTGNVVINGSKNVTTLNVGRGILNVGGNLNLLAPPGDADLIIDGGHINISGNLLFTNGQSDGSGNGNIKFREVDGKGDIYLGGVQVGTGDISNQIVIHTGPMTLPLDYFRSKQSGDWNIETSWESSHDGMDPWIDATKIPSGSSQKITVLANHQITLKSNSPAANLFVDGKLDCNGFIVNGPGPFTLNSGATIVINDLNGVAASGSTGSIQVGRTRTYSPDANYTYRGAGNQLTGDGLPAILNGILTIDKTALSSTVRVSHSTLITNLVNLLQGELIADDKLTLQSTAASYGQVGSINTTVAKVSDNVNVQSFLSGSPSSLTNRGNRMISFPVKDDYSKSLYQQLKEKIVITGPNTPLVGTDEGFDLGGWAQPFAVTLTTYSEPASPIASFIPVPTIKTRAEAGKTTFVFFRGSRVNASGNKVNTPYGFPEDVTANFKGTINQGDVQTSVINSNTTGDITNGMNAVGNPYPATLDWDAVWASNQTVLGVNEIRINKAGGGFVTRKVIANVPTATNTDETMASQYVRPGQGFYVKTLNSGTLIFKENHKLISQTAPRLLSLPSEELLATSLNDVKVKDIIQKNKFLRINIQQRDLKDETLILFKDGLSSKFDNNDAIYFAGNSVLIGSLSSDGQVTSINAMPDVKDVQELKLYVSANASGAAKLTFTDLSAGEGYQLFLRDVLSPDKLIDLKQQAVYEFSIDRANPATYGTNRFMVLFKPEPVVAPVFSALKVKSNVELQWSTVVASKVKYYEVEISEDNRLFKSIGQVTNAGLQDDVKYSFIDKTPSTSVRYYRLKQFNINGSVTFTDPQMIDLSAQTVDSAINITIYPNPSSEMIQVQFFGNIQAEIDAAIYSVQGKKMKDANFRSGELIRFEVSHLPQGVYFLELIEKEGNKVIAHSKFIVEQ